MEPRLTDCIPNWSQLVDAVRSRCTNRSSLLHGEEHWMRVAAAELKLLKETGGGNPTLVLVFALIHDSMRLNDGADLFHGRRAAGFLKALNGELLRLPADGLEILAAACASHSESRLTEEPTTAICWDADRLNLWRLGLEPDPRYLSTRAADEFRLTWAIGRQDGEFDWDNLYRDFEAEERRRDLLSSSRNVD